MLVFPEEECKKHVIEWILPLCREIERQTERPIKTVTPDMPFYNKKDNPVYMADIGGCLIYLTARTVGFNQFSPVLVVAEKSQRRQRHGVGHTRDYNPSKGDALPSFAKAVAKEEEVNIKAPPGVMLAPLEKGGYSLHIGTLKVSAAQAMKIAEILCK